MPVWKDTPITEIRRADVKELLRAKAATAPIAANRVLALLKCIFDFAIDEELIDSNPAARIRPEREVSRDRVLSAAEIKIVWQALNDAPRMDLATRTALKLLLVTGQRRGEVVGARWEEFDFERKEWQIPASRTKNKLPHIVPLSDLAIEMLDDLPDGECVFASATPDSITQAMRRGLPAMNLPGGPANPPQHRAVRSGQAPGCSHVYQPSRGRSPETCAFP